MNVKQLFDTNLPSAFKSNTAKYKLGGVILIRVSGDGGGTWLLNLNAPSCTAVDGKAECTIDMKVEDATKLIASPSLAMQMYFQGRIKVTGNPVLATKLGKVLG